MVWNKDLPLGTKAANLLDDDIRANNAALEAGLHNEHTLVSGGDQDLRHKFNIAANAVIEALSDYVSGALAISTDEVSGQFVLKFLDNAGTPAWHGVLDAYLNNANDWVNGQYHTTTALSAGANIASVWTAANIFTVTLDQNSTLDNPTGMPTTGTKSGVWYYIITQDDPARTLAFGGKFLGSPVISTVVDSVNVLQCVMDDAGNIQAQFMPRSATDALAGIVELATDAEALTGIDATRALTPDNLGQGHLTTWNAGYYRVIGTGADGTGLVEQFMVVANAANNDTITLPLEFSTANYNIQLTYEDASTTSNIRVKPASRTSTGFDISTGSTLDFLHVRAVGIVVAP